MIKENFYETMFILAPEAYARNQEEVTAKLVKTIESLGGKIRVSRLWEERKFAYPIKNHNRGVYWVVYYRITTDKIAELNYQFRLNNDVLRFLPIRLDSRLEEIVIQRSLAEPVAESDEQKADVAVDVEADGDDEEDEDASEVDSAF